MRNQSVAGDFPTVSRRLNELARDVRRIGDGYRADPEAIAMAKDTIARELTTLAREIGR